MKEFADEIRSEINAVLEHDQSEDYLSLISILGGLTSFRRTIIEYEKSDKLTMGEAQELETFRAGKYDAVMKKLPPD